MGEIIERSMREKKGRCGWLWVEVEANVTRAKKGKMGRCMGSSG